MTGCWNLHPVRSQSPSLILQMEELRPEMYRVMGWGNLMSDLLKPRPLDSLLGEPTRFNAGVTILEMNISAKAGRCHRAWAVHCQARSTESEVQAGEGWVLLHPSQQAGVWRGQEGYVWKVGHKPDLESEQRQGAGAFLLAGF